jgi:cytochrome P450
MVDWLNFTWFDIGDLCFGEPFGCPEKCQYENWMAQIGAAIELHYLSINLRHYPILNSLSKPVASLMISRDIVSQEVDYRHRTKAKVQRRLASQVDRLEIISQLVKSDYKTAGLDSEGILLNLMLFIHAASETTATVLTGALNSLVHPSNHCIGLRRKSEASPPSI